MGSSEERRRGDKKKKKGLSGKWRERAFVVGTTGVTASMEAAWSSIGHRKRSAPLSGIWTVTEVTQKLCHLLFSARVQRRPGNIHKVQVPGPAMGTGGGEENSRVEER